MKISICLGSSCHVKGSKVIVDMLKEAIEKNGLSDKVELAGSICMGQCAAKGVNVKIDDQIVEGGVTREGFDDFFKEYVINKLK